ncbi:MAG: hypothetical protein HFJ42_04910 [Clostridia bacterium]|nr:hypothetical protein [Clostridia bacterium]
MRKQNKGITLITLVITIVLLLILAFGTLKIMIDYNIIKLARKAGKDYSNSQNREISEIETAFMQARGEKPKINVNNKEGWAGKEGKKVTFDIVEGYKIKYTTDGTEPSINNGEEYSGEFIIKNNCTIKAVYIREKEIVGDIQEERIEKIDRNAPQNLKISLEAGKTAVTVNVTEAEDMPETPTDSCSGIAEYRFRNNNGEWTSWQTDKTYTFTEIYGDLAGVNCMVQAQVRDKAGNINEMEVTENTKTTCLNYTYYTDTKGKAIMSLSSTDRWGDITNTKANAGGSICATYYVKFRGANAVNALIVSDTYSGAQVYTPNYRELRKFTFRSNCNKLSWNNILLWWRRMFTYKYTC